MIYNYTLFSLFLEINTLILTMFFSFYHFLGTNNFPLCSVSWNNVSAAYRSSRKAHLLSSFRHTSPCDLSQLSSVAEGFSRIRPARIDLAHPRFFIRHFIFIILLPRCHRSVIAPGNRKEEGFNPSPLPSSSPPAEPRYRSQAHIAANGDVYPA